MFRDFREPPTKRRRGNNGSQGKRWEKNGTQQNRHHHWDEPTTTPSSAPVTKSKPKRYTIDRQLTQEEIWDDSALIEAWDAAVEEYESLNGPEKTWKTEPVHKSALWYAQPPEPQENDEEEEGEAEDDDVDAEGNELEEGEEAEADSAPIDFNTFVPSHDPTLGTDSATKAVAPTVGPYAPTALSTAVPDLTALTRDEIFEKAVSASYWAGYWTAMYHASGAKMTEQVEVDEEEAEADDMLPLEDSVNTSQMIQS
ncbi:hypothetical protein RhiJN_19641 [Ceratobasidium sp. AG-Ba]|nr:hypothetical protein RhiJN_19641 [Ceratobasidium sp. AG-Ba]QRW05690.1 hypothetical protein RhiLY_04689 [Ceratobasidium sp. AG-Ba]